MSVSEHAPVRRDQAFAKQTLPQGQSTWPEDVRSKGSPDDAKHRLGHGGTDVLKLDDALATVDDFVHAKLGL